MALAGGGSRARKRQRRLPTTEAQIRKAWAAYPSKSNRGDPFVASDLRGDQIVRTKLTFVRGSAVKAKGGRCVFFVVKDPSRRKPFEVTRLCKGGREWTGLRAYSSLKEAKADARWIAGRPLPKLRPW